MAKKFTHYIYCWRTGETYHVSVRPVNDPGNSVGTHRYASRQGRNIKARIEEARYKGKATIIRGVNPNKIKKK